MPLAHQPDGWRLDLDALARAFATHPAAYVLCNPQNPVGRVHTATELAALVRLARIYRVTLISDEIHGPLVLPGATFTPLLAVPGAAEVAVTVMSASKAWNLAGLKCAAVVGWHPPEATFLAWLDCSAIGPDDTARAQFLDRGRVALEPGLRFGAIGSGYARLNFATSETILDEAVTRMAAAHDC